MISQNDFEVDILRKEFEEKTNIFRIPLNVVNQNV